MRGPAHSLFGILFVIGAAVQYNDPDGVLWGAWYAGAAAACFAATRRPKEASIGALILLLGSVGWILAIVGGGMQPVTLAELVGGPEMKTIHVERWREAGGLALIGTWMLIIVLQGLKKR